MGSRAAVAKRQIAIASASVKNAALSEISKCLIEKIPEILEANRLDMDNAFKFDLSVVMQDRLMLNEQRIRSIASAVDELVAQEDVVGSIASGFVRPNGLKICKVRVPLGAIGIIFESRPNVSVDAATLCLKAGNSVILKGGKESVNSNRALVSIMRDALEKIGLSPDIIQFVEDNSREVTTELMKLSQYLDVLIPRGGAGLINAVLKNATVPVIQTGVGNCHTYADETADIDMAVNIIDNAKTQRPSVCNAIESLLIHSSIASELLPKLQERFELHKVLIKGCDKTREILGENILLATDEDYATEFHDYIISIKIVSSLDEALEHISKYGSGHSECIITQSLYNAERFQAEVDAAAVYVNASTRFTDGGEFGFGAEIGISTQKLHARGPMGLNELTTIKYIINGNGQIRE